MRLCSLAWMAISVPCFPGLGYDLPLQPPRRGQSPRMSRGVIHVCTTHGPYGFQMGNCAEFGEVCQGLLSILQRGNLPHPSTSPGGGGAAMPRSSSGRRLDLELHSVDRPKCVCVCVCGRGRAFPDLISEGTFEHGGGATPGPCVLCCTLPRVQYLVCTV